MMAMIIIIIEVDGGIGKRDSKHYSCREYKKCLVLRHKTDGDDKQVKWRRSYKNCTVCM